jgi:ribosomal protein S12 methylthiotransferase accessory factor
MILEMSFPGGAGVDATFKGHTVHTDQPAPYGEDTGPAPFDLFLASIGTCAAYYALRFCQQREVDTSELKVRLEAVRDPEAGRISTIRIHVRLPAELPDKYRTAVLRAIDQCAVKRHIIEPPAFEVVTEDG